MENQQFQAMLVPAQERLKKYTIEQLCEKGHISFDYETQEFVLMSMQEEIRIAYPSFEIKNKLDMWYHLTILQYMDTATGAALATRWIALTQMQGGISRGMGYEKELTALFEKHFANVSAESFLKAAKMLNGVKAEGGRADASVVIPYLPMFPICINFWEADEEFPAAGKVLVDANAQQYLTLEAAGAACGMVVQQLISLIMDEKGF